jgi:hypothetical protein
MRGLKPPPFSALSLSAICILGCIAIFLLPATAGAQPAPKPTTGYRIAGTVVNAASGEPVRRATVTALSEADFHEIESAETDNEGRFALDGLPAAKYPLTASKRGFLTSFYDEHDGGFNTAIVTGPDQDTSGLVFRLTPGALLHGVVTGDGGDPVEGAKVMLFLKAHVHNPGARITRAGETRTDDTGAYEFDGLAAGEYLLAVKAHPWYALNRSASGSRQQQEADPGATLDVTYPVTFFDSTTDESSAAGIVLAKGESEEANINLGAVPALHLMVESPRMQNGMGARAELRQTIFGTESSENHWRASSHSQTDTVEFTGVAPGRYELTQGDPPRVAELDATTSQRIDPSLGTPTVAVSGSLQAASGLVLPENLSVRLSPFDGTQVSNPLQTVSIRGSFSFTAVPQGSWELWAESPGKTLSISSISVGSRTHAGNQLTVRDKPIRVAASVNLSETRIEGFAHKDGKGRPGVMVVLVPKEPAAFHALARRDQSDSDGSFSLRDAAPGEYTVVAIEDGWELDWARPEVIARYLSKGIAVTVTESSGKLARLSEGVPVQSR